jgi:hypothetical protein
MQDTLIAGDTLNYSATAPDYPPSAGWVLRVRFTPRAAGVGSGVPHTATATNEGDVYKVQVAATVTATWAAGRYGWASWVERAGERYTLASGQLLVQADPATSAVGADSRTHAERVLDAVEAVIEGRATAAQSELQIGQRALKFIPMAELLAVRDRYRWEVRNQQAAARGLPSAGSLVVRL